MFYLCDNQILDKLFRQFRNSGVNSTLNYLPPVTLIFYAIRKIYPWYSFFKKNIVNMPKSKQNIKNKEVYSRSLIYLVFSFSCSTSDFSKMLSIVINAHRDCYNFIIKDRSDRTHIKKFH